MAEKKGGEKKLEPGVEGPKTKLAFIGVALIVVGIIYTVWDVWIRERTADEKRAVLEERDQAARDARAEAKRAAQKKE